MGSASSPTGMDANAAGGSPASGVGSDAGRQMLEQLMGKIRELGSTVDEMGSGFPALAPEVQQLKQIFKRMIVKAAQQAPQQTKSSQALPGGEQ